MRLEEKTSDRDLSTGPLCGELDGTLKSWISVTPKLAPFGSDSCFKIFFFFNFKLIFFNYFNMLMIKIIFLK
jgi:hypothetical protein